MSNRLLTHGSHNAFRILYNTAIQPSWYITGLTSLDMQPSRINCLRCTIRKPEYVPMQWMHTGLADLGWLYIRINPGCPVVQQDLLILSSYAYIIKLHGWISMHSYAHSIHNLLNQCRLYISANPPTPIPLTTGRSVIQLDIWLYIWAAVGHQCKTYMCSRTSMKCCHHMHAEYGIVRSQYHPSKTDTTGIEGFVLLWRGVPVPCSGISCWPRSSSDLGQLWAPNSLIINFLSGRFPTHTMWASGHMYYHYFN